MANALKPLNIEQLNQLQQETWTAGNFPMMGVELAIVGERLCEAVPVLAGDHVLDVGTASGNTALSAARRRARVMGVDITPTQLDRAKMRAVAEGLDIEFKTGDATALNFENASFDLVMSTFGAIFAPDPQKTAAEMARVCRPGGKIAMANWTPEGMLGKLFCILARYSKAESQVDLPVTWGDESVLKQRLESYVTDFKLRRRLVWFRSPSSNQWVEFMKTNFGPAILAVRGATPEAQEALTHEMSQLIGEYNRSPNGTVLSESEYLEVVATRR